MNAVLLDVQAYIFNHNILQGFPQLSFTLYSSFIHKNSHYYHISLLIRIQIHYNKKKIEKKKKKKEFKESLGDGLLL